ncbi:MAG TPA: xanthine dehydrogenase family protein subunit M, partial [Desulfurococcaceae archaeon]|nr:xanthine dehydrogenase family protein subunit M [Desulfurococcaceae archaeon]
MTMPKSVLVFHTLLPEFEYFRPKTLDEALELLNKYGEDAKILAGGTDLLVDMRMRIKKPKYVIDIKGIKELHVLKYEEGKGLTIGATVTLSELINNKIVKEKYYVLWDAVRQIADEHLRMRATLIGNICNASPAADSAPALLVLKAKVNIASVDGQRTIEIKDFFKWVKKTVLKPNEMVTSIFIPEPPKDAKGRYLKFVRSAEDLALVGIAGLVAYPRDPEKRIVRLAYSSVAPTPVVVEEVEELFKQNRPLSELVEEAVKIVMNKVSPITDVRATKELRQH